MHPVEQYRLENNTLVGFEFQFYGNRMVVESNSEAEGMTQYNVTFKYSGITWTMDMWQIIKASSKC